MPPSGPSCTRASPSVADRWRLAPDAKVDLAEIWFFGAERWGIAQADRYQDSLFDAFDLLADNPDLARLRGEVDPPVRVHPHRVHLIFFDALDDGIEIVRVLHARRNWRVVLD